MRPEASRPSRGESARLLLATLFGLGYAPLAPGTVASLPSVALAWALSRWGGSWALFAGFVLVTLVGFSVAGGAARSLGAQDPGAVVVDEVAGQLLTFLWVPLSGLALLLGFLLFRLFDVWKPYPLRRLELLPGGWGIMADDLGAGLYANLALHGALFGLARLGGNA